MILKCNYNILGTSQPKFLNQEESPHQFEGASSSCLPFGLLAKMYTLKINKMNLLVKNYFTQYKKRREGKFKN